jgi:hypothetical protein
VASPACWASTGWKRAATSLWAIVAGRQCHSFRQPWTIAAQRLRQSAEYLWPIVAANFHKSSQYLCAAAATCWRHSTEYLLPIAAAYLRKSSQYIRATRGWRQAAEYVGRVIAGHPGQSPHIRTALTAALAIASCLIGFVTTSALLRPPAPALAPSIHEAPLQPKLSWVTDYEIARAQRLGRQLLDISPAQLLTMYERSGSDAVATYRDDWVKLDYPIMSFDRQTFGKTTYDVIEAAAHFQSVFPGKIIAIFNAQQWGKQLHMHRAGDQIVAFCKFREIEREEVLTNIHRLWFYGTSCDLPQLLESTDAMNLR